MIRKVNLSDAGEIKDIYNYYILNSTFTFEEKEVSEKEMAGRISVISSEYPWYVKEENGKIIGYAYANKWKERSAYRFAVECTVYITPNQTGKGIGSELLKIILDDLKRMNFHAVIGGLSIPNEPSRRLLEKFGFIKVAHLKEVGFKFGKWIDVGYWELNLTNKTGL